MHLTTLLGGRAARLARRQANPDVRPNRVGANLRDRNLEGYATRTIEEPSHDRRTIGLDRKS